MIHIGFGLNDVNGRYSKFTGITIMSIFKSTTERVSVHILYDDSVSQKNLDYLKSLGDDKRTFVNMYKVNSDLFSALKGEGFNIGTMYRLAMPEVIPQDVSRLIYLDSDIIVNLDIRELYDLNLHDKSIAALPSPAPGFWVYDAKIVDNYFNNGVMLLDLKKIRSEHKLLEETKAFFDKFNHEPTCDQDAFNYIFQDDWVELPKIFNYTTLDLRGEKNSNNNCIYHYAGDVPNALQKEKFDQLFFSYWLQSPWVDQFQEYFIEAIKIREEQLDFMQHLLVQLNKKIIIWGAGSKYLKKILLHLPSKEIFLIDGDENKWGRIIENMQVNSPALLDKIEDYVVIIISGQYCDNISHKLKDMGLKENEDYFDGRLLLNEDEGGRMVSVDKGNLRNIHFRRGSILADLLYSK